MKTEATIENVNPQSGDVVLRAADDNYVMAQQIDAKPLRVGQVLVGVVETVGIETIADRDNGTTYEFFIEAYGLSREAALGLPQ